MNINSGIVALVNLKTDKKFIFFAKNIEQEIIDFRFNLDLGLIENKQLQEDYSKTGLEVFTFISLEKTEDSSRINYWKSLYDNLY